MSNIFADAVGGLEAHQALVLYVNGTGTILTNTFAMGSTGYTNLQNYTVTAYTIGTTPVLTDHGQYTNSGDDGASPSPFAVLNTNLVTISTNYTTVTKPLLMGGTSVTDGSLLTFTNGAGAKFSLSINSTTNGFVFIP
jgi:hypothetical protein